MTVHVYPPEEWASAVRDSDGATIRVPRAWLTPGHPYRHGLTPAPGDDPATAPAPAPARRSRRATDTTS